MKKQIKSLIKAHLLRGAFYVLLLVAICVIPFALAQRNSNNGRVAVEAHAAVNTNPAAVGTQADVPSFTGALEASRAPYDAPIFSAQSPSAVTRGGTQTSGVPERSGRLAGVHNLPILPAPKAPQAVLYDQYNSPSNVFTLSATFADLPNYSSDLADDFVVPAGQTWNVQSIDADGAYFNCPNNNCIGATDWNVFFYLDNGSGFPGTQVYSATHQPVTHIGTTFTVSLPTPAGLTAGTYWVEIQANMTFNSQGEWGWNDRTVQSNSAAAWQNPGGAFCACPSWMPRILCFSNGDPSPDQVFRLNGTIGSPVTPTPTASSTPTPTATATPCDTEIIVNGGFETGSFSPGWVIDGTVPSPVIAYSPRHSGIYSAFAGGNAPTQLCGNGTEPSGNSSFYQQFTVPTGGGTLSFWHWDCTTDFINFDWQDAYITDSNGTLLQTIFHQCLNGRTWIQQTVDMTPYAGMTVRIKFLVHQDGFGDLTGMYVDDVQLLAPCGTPTPTPTASPTPTPTASPTPTPTPTPPCGQLRVLIAYADGGWEPSVLRHEIAAEQGVAQADVFDAYSDTPTLSLLHGYDVVFAFSNTPWNDPVAMGNVLADYEDAGGIVVVGTSAWDQAGCWHLQGRWMSDGYSPFNSTYERNFSDNTANILDPSHTLMAGVVSLSAYYRSSVTLAEGATAVAMWTDGPPAVAYKANNGHTAVGINALLDGYTAFRGQWGRVIVNAGRWLLNCGPLPTPPPPPPCPPIVINGGISNTDPTQTGRLLPNFGVSFCGSNTQCQMLNDGQHHYQAYTFTNTTGADQCVYVDVTTGCPFANLVFTAVYLGSFDPNNICNGRIADEGVIPWPESEFSFIAGNGQTYVLVVSEVDPGQGCPSYTVTVTGLCQLATPTPTPTPTPTQAGTATATPTAAATASQTPTATASFTPRPTPTPRSAPPVRTRPTPPPRP